MIVIDGTPELMKAWYAGKQTWTGKTIFVVDDDEKPVAMAGIMIRDKAMMMYSEMSDEFREHKDYKRTLIKGYRKLLEKLPKSSVYAIADEKITGSADLLQHMGFEHIEGTLWKI